MYGKISSCLFIFMFLKIFEIEGQNFAESTTATLSLIADYGYPAEEHKVTTADIYILTIYRIPYSPKDNSTSAPSKRSVAFLMHGLGESSCDWVLSGYPRGLAFFLSDAGYDFWMENARGTRFRKDHVNLLVSDPEYWNFDWHEIGIYDLPANVDYILKNTSNAQLHYIGHSQGTTAFFVATSRLQSLNEKIKTASLLAPVAYMHHGSSPILKGAPFYGQSIPIDYGLHKNELVYKQSGPPIYKLERIRAPVYIYHSEVDSLADPTDVLLLIYALQPSIIRKVYKMQFETWNHIYVIIGNNFDEVLYN